MGKLELARRRGFWLLAPLWLPAGIVASAIVRIVGGPEPLADQAMWTPMVLMAAQSLIFVAPCGLPLALASRWLWRLGYRRAAWSAGVGLGAVTVLSSLIAGLLGPLGIAAYAAILSLPVWLAAWWLSRVG